MDTKDIVAAAERAADRVLDRVPAELDANSASLSAAGRLRSGSHLRENAAICARSFAEARQQALMVVAELAGNGAKDLEPDIRTMLTGRMERALDMYGTSIASVHGEVGAHVASVRSEMAEKSEGDLLDLRIGLVGGVRADKIANAAVTIGQMNGQIAINSPGAAQSVGRDLNANIGASTISGLIAELRQAVEPADIDADLKDEILDQAIALEREVQSSSPEPGRLKRVGKKLVDLGEKAGAGAVGGIAARVATWLAGIG